jgi:hypothetical protein
VVSLVFHDSLSFEFLFRFCSNFVFLVFNFFVQFQLLLRFEFSFKFKIHSISKFVQNFFCSNLKFIHIPNLFKIEFCLFYKFVICLKFDFLFFYFNIFALEKLKRKVTGKRKRSSTCYWAIHGERPTSRRWDPILHAGAMSSCFLGHLQWADASRLLTIELVRLNWRVVSVLPSGATQPDRRIWPDSS